MIDIKSQFIIARNRGVPILCVETPDPAQTISWIHLMVGSEIPIVRWDSAFGLLGVNNVGGNTLMRVAEVETLAELKNLTTDSVNALNLVLRLPEKSVAIFLNLPSHWHHPEVSQSIWNVRDLFKSNLRTLVILAPDISPPPTLQHDLVIFEESLPSEEEISKISRELFEAGELPAADEKTEQRICETVRGLPTFAAEQAIALSLNGNGIKFDVLFEHKRRAIENTDGLRVYTGDDSFNDIEGLRQIKTFITKLFHGKKPPKAVVRIEEIEKLFAGAQTGIGDSSGVSQDALGVILSAMEDNRWNGLVAVGVPGAGKSALSKAIGRTFDVPTIDFDVGATRHSLVGQSEQSIRSCMRVIHAIAGQDAFFIASCNRFETLPPELRRRFTYGIWLFDLPDDEELASIWSLQRKKYEIPESDVVPTDARYTGADARNICEISSRLSISLQEATSYIVPISVSDPGTVQKIQEAANNRFLSASRPGVYKKPTSSESSHETPIKRKLQVTGS